MWLKKDKETSMAGEWWVAVSEIKKVNDITALGRSFYVLWEVWILFSGQVKVIGRF